MTVRLPLLLSIPHGGNVVPDALCPHILPSLEEILLDGDLWAGTLFDIAAKVFHIVKAELPRAIVDLNRSPDDFRPDGIIKEVSLFNTPIWMVKPDVVFKDHLLATHYHPYHAALVEAAEDPSVRVGLDCHTMWAKDPFGKNTEDRPLICLSNLGDGEGNPLEEPLSAPQELLLALKRAFESEFGAGMVRLNTPFRGGEIIKSMRDATTIPWVQLEVNRSLYEPKERENITPVPAGKDRERVHLLKGMIEKALASIDYEDPRYRRMPLKDIAPRRPRADD